MSQQNIDPTVANFWERVSLKGAPAHKYVVVWNYATPGEEQQVVLASLHGGQPRLAKVSEIVYETEEDADPDLLAKPLLQLLNMTSMGGQGSLRLTGSRPDGQEAIIWAKHGNGDRAKLYSWPTPKKPYGSDIEAIKQFLFRWMGYEFGPCKEAQPDQAQPEAVRDPAPTA